MENQKIYASICAIMEDVGAVTKNKKNTQGSGFMYRGIDDVMNALNPAMAKHKVFAVPEILEQIREERTSRAGSNLTYSFCKIKYTFYAEDGSNVSATVIGEAMDSGDKATNKSMSIAFKYACFQVFCIPTEEMVDPDAQSRELAKRNTKPSANKNTNTKSTQSGSAKEPTEAEIMAMQEKTAKQKIDATKISVIRSEILRTGINEQSICGRYKVAGLEEITEDVFAKVINALKNTKSKEE